MTRARPSGPGKNSRRRPPPAPLPPGRDPGGAPRAPPQRRSRQAAETRLPVENRLSPGGLRRLSWDPPKPCDGQAVADALAGHGARPWQIGLTAEPIARALCDLPAHADEAAILSDAAESGG